MKKKNNDDSWQFYIKIVYILCKAKAIDTAEINKNYGIKVQLMCHDLILGQWPG